MTKSSLPNLTEVTTSTFDQVKSDRKAARARITAELKSLPYVAILLNSLTGLAGKSTDHAFNVFQPRFTQNIPGLVIVAEDGARLTVNRAYDANGRSVPNTYSLDMVGGEQKYALDDPEAENRMLVKITQWAASHYPLDTKSTFEDCIKLAWAIMNERYNSLEANKSTEPATEFIYLG